MTIWPIGEFVIEAIVEAEAAKLDVFGRLSKVLDDPDAVMASNTSAIPIMKLAMATDRPAQVIGMHFFNPVPVMGAGGGHLVAADRQRKRRSAAGPSHRTGSASVWSTRRIGRGSW